jgi:uncharacterized protein (UPF0332 family)
MSDADTLYQYRLEQARTTLAEAERMLSEAFSSRSIINRAYYAMFYMVLALLLKTGTVASSSKHTGILSIFDREFILSGKVNRENSRLLHRMFDRRLELDYKDYAEPSMSDAHEGVANARAFVEALTAFVSKP